MLSIKRFYFSTCILGFLAPAAFAQPAKLVFKGVEENRNIGFLTSKLVIYTEFMGMPVDQHHKISLKEVQVVDNLGNALKLLNGYPYPTDYFSSGKELTIGVEPPLRNAQNVSVKGTIQYFTISEKLQSELKFDHIKERYHQNLLAHTGLEAQLMLIDLEGLNALKNEDEAAYHSKVNGLFEHAAHYLDRALEDYVYFQREDKDPVLHFYKADPRDEIVEIKLYDKTGVEIARNSFSRADTYGLVLEEPLSPEMQLRLIVKKEGTVKEIPFSFKDIKLP